MQIRSLVIGYCFLFVFSGAAMYIFGMQVFVQIWGSILGYSIIIYILYFVWTKLRYRKHLSYLYFFSIFIYKITLICCSFLLLIGGFVVYQNKINPAELPYYILSDGNQTLRFQTMSHIASASFYENVKHDIEAAKKNNYVLYYEGVRPGTPENMEKFNTALGINIEPDTYNQLSELYGVVAQDNSDFLGIINNKDYNVDLDIDTIIEIYEKNNGGQTTEKSTSLPSLESYNLEEYINSFSKREKEFLKYVNQAFMNAIIKNEYARNTIMNVLGNEDIFSVILDDRNKHLVSTITENSQKNIYIIYGLMHFDGVYDLLQNHDANWKIVETGSYRVIEPSL